MPNIENYFGDSLKYAIKDITNNVYYPINIRFSDIEKRIGGNTIEEKLQKYLKSNGERKHKYNSFLNWCTKFPGLLLSAPASIILAILVATVPVSWPIVIVGITLTIAVYLASRMITRYYRRGRYAEQFLKNREAIINNVNLTTEEKREKIDELDVKYIKKKQRLFKPFKDLSMLPILVFLGSVGAAGLDTIKDFLSINTDGEMIERFVDILKHTFFAADIFGLEHPGWQAISTVMASVIMVSHITDIVKMISNKIASTPAFEWTKDKITSSNIFKLIKSPFVHSDSSLKAIKKAHARTARIKIAEAEGEKMAKAEAEKTAITRVTNVESEGEAVKLTEKDLDKDNPTRFTSGKPHVNSTSSTQQIIRPSTSRNNQSESIHI